MTIVVSSSSGSTTLANADYSSLQTMVGNWLNRGDLTALIPDFIALAEEKLNRALRVRQMEVDLSAREIVSGLVAVPTGTVGIKTLWIEGNPRTPLRSQSFDFVKSQGVSGVASVYSWQGDNLHFNGSGTVTGVLYQRIPSLSIEDTTNWLLTESPSSYLFGALREAFEYIRNDAERDRWAARQDQVIAAIVDADMRDRFGGPLQIQVG